MTDRDLFILALEQSEDKRHIWLDRVCGDDVDLRRRLDVLLRAHEMASQFLASPAVEQFAADHASPPGSTGSVDPAKGDHDDTADLLALLAPADKPGQLGKLEHYEVLEVVGRGAMGVVVKAFDPKLHRVVAIKLMARHLAANPAARRRFEREARAVAAVRNAHVVAIHDVGPAAPIPYLVMEFIGGISLQDRLDQRGPLEVKEILRIGMQAAQGLSAAHAQGLVHRDVKPANILLENGVECVKITDFGLARAVDDVNLTQSGVITGTPNYMSPEQADGGSVDHRSDLFSLGSVLYALATGHPPFRASGMAGVLKRVAADTPRPVREVNADVPDWLEAIIAKLHAKDPTERFQTATEVAELLGQHLAHLQQPGRVPRPMAVALAPTPAPLQAAIPLRVFLIINFGILAVLMLVVLGVEVWENPGSPAPMAFVGAFASVVIVILLVFAWRPVKPPTARELAQREPPPTPPSDGPRGFSGTHILLSHFLITILVMVAGLAAGKWPHLDNPEPWFVSAFAALPLNILCLALVYRARVRRAAAKAPESNAVRWWRIVWWLGFLVLPGVVVSSGLLEHLTEIDRHHGPQAPPLALLVPTMLALSWIGLGTLRRPGSSRRLNWRGLVVLAALAALGLLLFRTLERDRVSRPPAPTNFGRSPVPASLLKVTLNDPGVTAVATCEGAPVNLELGPDPQVRSGHVRAGGLTHLVLQKGGSKFHEETFRLRPGEERNVHVPTVVLAERMLTLVPKAGRFPKDVTRMQISPDRSAVAVETANGPIVVFDLETGRERFTLERTKDDNTAFGFTPDGKQLAYLTQARHRTVLRVVDARDGGVQGKDVEPTDRPFARARALTFSPDGKRLAVSSAYDAAGSDLKWSRLHRWEWPNGKPVPAKADEIAEGTFEALRFSDDGHAVWCLRGKKGAFAWGWGPGQAEGVVGVGGERKAWDLVAFSRRGTVLAGREEVNESPTLTAIEDGELPEGESFVARRSPEGVPFGSLALSPDGLLLAAGNKGVANASLEKCAAVRLWDTRDGGERGVLLGHTDWVLDLAFTPDAAQLISASKDGTVRWWRLAPVPPGR